MAYVLVEGGLEWEDASLPADLSAEAASRRRKSLGEGGTADGG